MKKEIEAIGLKAVQALRRARLKRGDFFMINVNTLPPEYCYLEYPEGTIKLATYQSQANYFTIIRELEAEENSLLRQKIGLELID